MLKIGLTGGIGSGKTTVSHFFEQLGITVIDTDVISREVTSAGGRAIRDILSAFGNAAIDPDGAMDRGYIRDLVFETPAERRRLESILHPIIQEEAIRRIEDCGSVYCIVSVPLFFESEFWPNLVDRVLTIDAPEELQITRVQKRSGLAVVRLKPSLRPNTQEKKDWNVLTTSSSTLVQRKNLEGLSKNCIVSTLNLLKRNSTRFNTIGDKGSPVDVCQFLDKKVHGYASLILKSYFIYA